MLRKNKIWKVVRSCDTSLYHIWNRISLCVDTNFFSVVLYFTRARRLYLSQKNHWYIINLDKKWYTTDIFRIWLHFLRVNVTFYDAVNVIYDIITTANPFPYTAKFMFVGVRNNKQIRC